jgi:diaminohydroxyphosphoribosylaminopyrimidine deaminase/5-amino-6-(5-phosphoribosylamino)uracil reductase
MAIALELAALGRGEVEPNPMVGAVIVRDDEEIARGWHERFGAGHAEIEAIRAARAGGHDLTGSTMYVTLEPCCHHGKTPPCTEAIVAAGIARVVVAMSDPDASVSGRGIEALRSAGVRVDVGTCSEPARKLLAPYCKLRTKGTPWVICKWAQTSDGYLSLPDKRWISGQPARDYVHRLRGGCDGILVGVETVLTDDPALTNRSGSGRQPGRVILDSGLRIPLECQLTNSPGVCPVIVATIPTGPGENAEHAEALRRKGVEVIELPPDADGRVDLDDLLSELGRRCWTYLLIEGGPTVLRSVIDGGRADELLVFVSPDKAPEGCEDLPRFDIAELREELSIGEPQETKLGDDHLLHFIPRQ